MNAAAAAQQIQHSATSRSIQPTLAHTLHLALLGISAQFAEIRKEIMSVNQNVLERNWDSIKQKVHARWDQVSTDELEETRGDVEQMIGLIQHQSGTGRRFVERYLEELTDTGSRASQAMEAVRSGAEKARQSVQQQIQHAGSSVRAGYAQTESTIQQRPLTSTLVCFTAGLATGLVVGLTLRSR